MKPHSAIALGTLCLLITHSPALASLDPFLEQQVKAVANRLEGVMDTAAQAAANPKAPNVKMTTCRVTVTDAASSPQANTVTLYQEQALTNNLIKPYRQRFLQISASSYSQSVRSRSFKPAQLATWINLCSKPLVDRTVTTSSLGTAVCNVFLKRSGNDYVGNTPADGCPANVRGAVRIKNHIVLHTVGMDTWDRGFDATGKQVWGANAESYQFRRSQ